MIRRLPHRRFGAALAALVLGMLLGVAVTVTRGAAAAVAGVPVVDPSVSTSCLKKNGSPARPKKCASATPTPDPTSATPYPGTTTPTPQGTGAGQAPGVGAPAGAVRGAAAPTPGATATGTEARPDLSGAVPAAAGGTDLPASTPAPGVTAPASSMPVWPILWTGTAVITLVSVGVLLALRDRRSRAAEDAPDPVDGSAPEPPAPHPPIRLAWTDPPE